jgi:predicted alpha-1,6-mannanase (GH76 family)
MAEQPLKLDIDKLLSDPKFKDELLKSFIAQTRVQQEFDSDHFNEMAANLKKLKNNIDKPIDFKEGDIVIWKKGLKNKNWPLYNQPAIVMKKYDNPIYDEKANASNHIFKEPLDVELGIIMDNNDFLTFHYDSHRFIKKD